MNNRAFTLIEATMAVSFTVLLMSAVFGFYTTSGQIYSSGLIGQTLQDAANTVIRKIIEGKPESGSVYGLVTSASYYIPTGDSSKLYFCQGNSLTNPCNPSDPTARWYALNSTKTSLLYYHPTSDPQGYDVLYTAPPGSTLNLRFAPPALPPPPEVGNQAVAVEINVVLTQNLPQATTNQAVASSGTATTLCLLRNHS